MGKKRQKEKKKMANQLARSCRRHGEIWNASFLKKKTSTTALFDARKCSVPDIVQAKLDFRFGLSST